MARKIKLVVSDCHVGKGKFLPNGHRNPLERFFQDEQFAAWLQYYSSGEYYGADAELIINGDFFEMLQIDEWTDQPQVLTENMAADTIERIIAGHHILIEALRKFASIPHHHITLILGNHDPGFLWPAVQEILRQHISPHIRFFETAYEFEGIRIEHGNQYDLMNQFDPERFFLPERFHGEKILNLPWGCLFVVRFVNRAKRKRNFVDSVRPFRKLFRWGFIFDFWFTLKCNFQIMWLFLTTRFIPHPTRYSRFKKTLGLIRELFVHPPLEEFAEEILSKSEYQTLIMGHNHLAHYIEFPNGKTYINTGTWTELISLNLANLGTRLTLTYALIDYGSEGKPATRLMVWKGAHDVTTEFKFTAYGV